jgi:hypothetical protein
MHVRRRKWVAPFGASRRGRAAVPGQRTAHTRESHVANLATNRTYMRTSRGQCWMWGAAGAKTSDTTPGRRSRAERSIRRRLSRGDVFDLRTLGRSFDRVVDSGAAVVCSSKPDAWAKPLNDSDWISTAADCTFASATELDYELRADSWVGATAERVGAGAAPTMWTRRPTPPYRCRARRSHRRPAHALAAATQTVCHAAARARSNATLLAWR